MISRETLELPLLTAVKEKQYILAESLLQQGAKGTALLNGDNALHVAVNNNDREMLALLLKYDTDLSTKNSAGHTPAVSAAYKNFWDCVITIAQSKREVLDGFPYGKFEYGNALICCARDNHDASVEALLKAGATTGWFDPNTKNTALYFAAKFDNPAMIKLLLAYNADLSVLNKAKEKPVVFAANLQKWNCVIEFARAKKEEFTDAIVNGKYEYGHALLICAKANRYKAARALLQANATTNWYFPDKNTTALHHAAMNNTTAMVTLLMTSKADPNVKTLKGETPLQLATDNKFWTCALAFTKPERYLINEKEATALKMSLFYLFAAQCNPENKFHHVHFPVLKIILQIVYGYINSPDIYDFDTAKRYFVDLRPDRNFIRSATLFVDKFSSCGKLRQFVKAQSPESAEFADSLKKTISTHEPVDTRATKARTAIGLFVQAKAGNKSRAVELLTEHALLPAAPAPQ